MLLSVGLVPVEDSVTDVIGLLNNKTAGRGSSSSDDETSQPGEYEDSDEYDVFHSQDMFN